MLKRYHMLGKKWFIFETMQKVLFSHAESNVFFTRGVISEAGVIQNTLEDAHGQIPKTFFFWLGIQNTLVCIVEGNKRNKRRIPACFHNATK